MLHLTVPHTPPSSLKTARERRGRGEATINQLLASSLERVWSYAIAFRTSTIRKLSVVQAVIKNVPVVKYTSSNQEVNKHTLSIHPQQTPWRGCGCPATSFSTVFDLELGNDLSPGGGWLLYARLGARDDRSREPSEVIVGMRCTILPNTCTWEGLTETSIGRPFPSYRRCPSA